MSQLNIENQDIENQRLEIGAETVCFLGPNLTLRNCTLVLKVAARNLLLLQPRQATLVAGHSHWTRSGAASRTATSPTRAWTPAASLTVTLVA